MMSVGVVAADFAALALAMETSLSSVVVAAIVQYNPVGSSLTAANMVTVECVC